MDARTWRGTWLSNGSIVDKLAKINRLHGAAIVSKMHIGRIAVRLL